MSAIIYLEGGGDSSELQTRCRMGFRKLLERCGFAGQMPRLVACGGRSATFDDFKTAHRLRGQNDFVAMLVDSEDLMADIEKCWEHLQKPGRDEWKRPEDASDEQVLMMTTCMETWIVCDRDTLRTHYGKELQESALPSLVDLEMRPRREIQDALCRATRKCTNAYRKGKRSFEVLAQLQPQTLEKHLPSFARTLRVLRSRLLASKLK